MPKTVGYMLTWTTYGTWLQGDERGYVKDGQILRGDQKLVGLCEKFQKGETVSRFKNVTASALKKHGRSDRVWTRGFDKRFCFDCKDLVRRIQYVNNHND